MTPISPFTIAFQTIPALTRQWLHVQRIFSKNGYVILSPPTSDPEIALRVSRLFGPIQGHIRAPLDGVVEIRSQSIGKNGKQVVSDLPFFAHTDGAYLQGIAATDGKVYRVSPPKMVALQCVQPAKRGGVSFLVDGHKILSDLSRTNPSMITKLSESSIAMCRDSHLLAHAPVIGKLPTGFHALRFSYDRDLHASKETLRILSLFNRRYVQNSSYITHLPLKEREILVFDNHRLLHGRTGVEGDRLLRRIWIQDETLSTPVENPQGLPYFGSIENSTLAFERFKPYLGVKPWFSSPKVEAISTGIRLK